MDDFEQRLKNAALVYKNQGQMAADPVTAAIGLFDTALKLWSDKNKTKYIDRKISLMKDRAEEANRPDHSRMALDLIDQQLRILEIAFVAEANETK